MNYSELNFASKVGLIHDAEDSEEYADYEDSASGRDGQVLRVCLKSIVKNMT